MGPNTFDQFIDQIKRGREFEHWERTQWTGDLNEQAQFEALLHGKANEVV